MDDPSQLEARRRKVLDNAEARLRFIKEGTPWRNNDIQSTDTSLHEGHLGSNEELVPKQDDSKCVNIEESQGPSKTSNETLNDEPVQNRLSKAESKNNYTCSNSEQTDKFDRTEAFIEEEVNYLPDIKRIQEDIDKNFVMPSALSQASNPKKYTDEVFKKLTIVKMISESNELGLPSDPLSQASKDKKVTEVLFKAINLMDQTSESNEPGCQSDPLSKASKHKHYTDNIYKVIDFLNLNLPPDSVEPGYHSEMLSEVSRLKKETEEAFKTNDRLKQLVESNEHVCQSNPFSQAPKHTKHTGEFFESTLLKLPSGSNEPVCQSDPLSQAPKPKEHTDGVSETSLLKLPLGSNEPVCQSIPLSQAPKHKEHTDEVSETTLVKLPLGSNEPVCQSNPLSQAPKDKEHTDEVSVTNPVKLPSGSNEPVCQSNPLSQAPKPRKHTDEVFKTTHFQLPSGSNECNPLRTFKHLFCESSNERQEQKRRVQELNQSIWLSCFVMLCLGVFARISYAVGLSWFFGEIMLVPFITAAIPRLISLLREPPTPSGAVAQILIMAGIKTSVLRRAFTAVITFRSFLQFFSVYLIAFIFTHQLAEYTGNLVKIHP